MVSKTHRSRPTKDIIGEAWIGNGQGKTMERSGTRSEREERERESVERMREDAD
jgi:hypothetical protein